MRAVVHRHLFGCNTAVAAEDGTTLQDSLLSLGVDVVIAFPGYLHDRLGRAWAKEFWCFATTGHGAGLYDCDFWDSGAAHQIPGGPRICLDGSDELPSIDEAADCAAAVVVSEALALDYSQEYIDTISQVVIDGESRSTTLNPSRFGAKISGVFH